VVRILAQFGDAWEETVMKVTLEISGAELVLLYLATGNEDAGRIVSDAAREYARMNPPIRKYRKHRAEPLAAPGREGEKP
jgi:hypothetical protein